MHFGLPLSDQLPCNASGSGRTEPASCTAGQAQEKAVLLQVSTAAHPVPLKHVQLDHALLVTYSKTMWEVMLQPPFWVPLQKVSVPALPHTQPFFPALHNRSQTCKLPNAPGSRQCLPYPARLSCFAHLDPVSVLTPPL